MPKARIEIEIANDGIVKTIEIETAKGGAEGGTVKVRYTVPANANAFQDFVLGLKDQADGGALFAATYGEPAEHPDRLPNPLAWVYGHYVNSIDKAMRARAYENAQALSTEISRGAGQPKFDLMTVPTAKLVLGINGIRGTRANNLMLLEVADPDSLEHADEVRSVDRKLNYRQFQTAGRRLVESGKARENEASGMLEVVAA